MLTLDENYPSITPVAAKSATGIETPELSERTDAHQRLFLCRGFATSAENVLYGDCAGQQQCWSVSRIPIVSTLYSSHPYLIETGKGGIGHYLSEDNIMPPLSVCDTSISIRNDLYSLNDLHRAAGAEKNQQPAFFMRNEQAQALIAEIDKSANSQISHQIIRGAHGGTFVCKELVYAYAMWISPKFNLAVIRAFDQLASGGKMLPAPAPAHDPAFLTIHHSAVDETGACIVTRNEWGGTRATPINPESVALLKAATAFIDSAKAQGMLVINPQDLLRKLAL